jgi:hypothetical protein
MRGIRNNIFSACTGTLIISVLPSLSLADAYVSIDIHFLYSVWSCDQTMNGVIGSTVVMDLGSYESRAFRYSLAL